MANFIQTAYTDSPSRKYPGELATSAEGVASVLRGYPISTDIVMGLGVVVDTAVTDLTSATVAPFSVKLPSLAADQLVGIAYRPLYPTYNSTDPADPAKLAAAYEAKRNASIISFGSGAVVYVKLYGARTVVTFGAVYMAYAAANDAGNIPIGSFCEDTTTNVGLVLIQRARWYEDKTTTVSSINNVARIELLAN